MSSHHMARSAFYIYNLSTVWLLHTVMSGIQEENTPMHLAASKGHAEILQKILETGVSVDKRNIVSMMMSLYT